MKTHQTTFKKAPCSHAVPTVIVSISDHEARKNKKEIDCQITMIDNLSAYKGNISFKAMKHNYHHSGYPSKPIEYFITGF